MIRIAIALLLASYAFGQQESNKITIIPNPTGTSTGSILFQDTSRTNRVNLDNHGTGILYLGNGTPGNRTGELRLGNLDANGASVTFSGVPAGSTSDAVACLSSGGVLHKGGCTAGHAMMTVLDTAGCDPTGATDSTTCINTAISAAAGGALRVPAGTYLVGEINPVSDLLIACDSGQVLFKRAGSITSGRGWWDFPNLSNITVDGCALDGQVTTPATFDRASLGSSLSSTFTLNSSIWLHGGKNITFHNVTVQHSGGYPIINDASSAIISDLTYSGLTCQDNRSFLFGSPGDYNYGSWQGCIINYTDSAYYIENLSIVDSLFQRLTGHAIFWDARNGNNTLSHEIHQDRNTFRVIGLDAIENSGFTVGTTANNAMDLIGFISVSDSDNTGTARWYNGPSGNVPAVAIDTASLVTKLTISGNVIKRINGGAIDGDGLGNSKVEGNVISNPKIGDADFDATIAGQMGPAVYAPSGVTSAGQNWVYGFNSNNTNNTSQGAEGVSLVSNQFYGIGCPIKLYGAKNFHVEGNQITRLGDSNGTYDHNFCQPIILGTLGVGRGANGNTVSKNKVTYSGSTGDYAVREDNQYGAFASTDRNYVYNNDLPTTLAPFSKDSVTSSVTFGEGRTLGSGLTTAYYDTCNAATGSTTVNCIRQQVETSGGVSTFKLYKGGTNIAGAIDTGVFFAQNGFAVGATGIVDNAYNFFGHSLSVGSTPTIAASAAGLTVDLNRNAFLNSLYLGTNGSSPVQVIKPTGEMSASAFWMYSGATSRAITSVDTTTSPCSSGSPCFNIGNVHNIINDGNTTTTGNVAAGSYYAFLGSTSKQIVAPDTTSSGCSSGSPCFNIGNVRNILANGNGTFGSSSFTGATTLLVRSAGSGTNTADYSSITSLLGTGASTFPSVFSYLSSASVVQESGLTVGVISPVGDTNWQTGGVYSLVVNKSSSHCCGGGVVAGVFDVVNNASGANAWALNTVAKDFINDNYFTHVQSGLAGVEMDANIADPSTTYSAIGMNVEFKPTVTSASHGRMTGIRWNIVGSPTTATGYFDYALNSDDYAAKFVLSAGRQPLAVSNDSQIIELGSPGGIGHIYENSTGSLILSSNAAHTHTASIDGSGNFVVATLGTGTVCATSGQLTTTGCSGGSLPTVPTQLGFFSRLGVGTKNIFGALEADYNNNASYGVIARLAQNSASATTSSVLDGARLQYYKLGSSSGTVVFNFTAASVGSVFTVTVNGVNYNYTQASGDTADTIARNLMALIDVSDIYAYASVDNTVAGRLVLSPLQTGGFNVVCSATGNGSQNLVENKLDATWTTGITSGSLASGFNWYSINFGTGFGTELFRLDTSGNAIFAGTITTGGNYLSTASSGSIFSSSSSSDSSFNTLGGATLSGPLIAKRLKGQTVTQASNDTLYLGDASQVNFFFDRDCSGGIQCQVIQGYNTPMDSFGSDTWTLYEHYWSSLGHGSQKRLVSTHSRGTSGGPSYVAIMPDGASGSGSTTFLSVGAMPTQQYALEVNGVAEAASGFFTSSFGTTAINAPNGTVASLNMTVSGNAVNAMQFTGGGGIYVNQIGAYVGGVLTVGNSTSLSVNGGNVSAFSGFASSNGNLSLSGSTARIVMRGFSGVTGTATSGTCVLTITGGVITGTSGC